MYQCLLTLSCWLSLAASIVAQQRVEDQRVAANRGREFLVGLMVPELNLLPEFQGHHVVWLYHDNYLARKVLARSHPDVARRIQDAMSRYGVERSGKIELLFGESTLPLKRYELRDVSTSGRYLIRSEFTLDQPFNDVSSYADLLCFSAIAEPASGLARNYWLQALAMWDGTGIEDRVARKVNQYATYKLALTLIASKRFPADLQTNAMQLAAIESRLLRLQADSGGWITDYKRDGSPVGFANVETTCMAILALDP